MGRADAESKPRSWVWWQIVLFGAAACLLVLAVVASLSRQTHEPPPMPIPVIRPKEIRVPDTMRLVERVPLERGGLAGCNVVLVTLDTTRADRIGCYGNDEIRTPNLDALAQRGVLFTRALAPNPTTLPTHASILTGLYPYHHGARANGLFQLSEDHQTLAEILDGAGYKTGAFISTSVLDSGYGLAQGFGRYDDDMKAGRERTWLGDLERTGEKTTDQALGWLRENADRPLFLWVHLYDPHAPFTPAEPYSTQYARMPYDGELAFVDEQIGRLMFELEKLGKTEDTLFVVVADHGEGLGQHKEMSHGFLVYDSTLHIPLIISCGSKLGGGVYVDEPVSAVDVTPTILGLLGIASPDGLDGIDLTQATPQGRKFYFDNLEAFSEFGFAPMLGVYAPPLKYIWGPDPELYDLSSDPYEKSDLAESEPETVATLEGYLKEFFGEELHRAAFAAPTHSPSSEELAKLQALGYAGTGMGTAPPIDPLPDPKSVMDLFYRIEHALSFGGAGDVERVAAMIEELAQQYPDAYIVYRHLGQVYWELEQYEKAQAAYERCLQLRPDLPMPCWSLAKTLIAQGKLAEAIDPYKQALELSPKNVAIGLELGGLYMRVGRFEDGVEIFRAISEIAPSHDLELEGMVAGFERVGRGEEVEVLLEDWLAAQPRSLAVRNSLVKLLLARGDVARSVELLRDGIELFPDRTELTEKLARILATTADEESRNPPQAIETLEGSEAAGVN